MTDEEYTKKHDELMQDLPTELRSAISYMAYERGHSAGNEDVLNILGGIVYDLKKPLKAFGERCFKEGYSSCYLNTVGMP